MPVLSARVTCMRVALAVTEREREILLDALIQKLLKVHFLKINYLGQRTFDFLG